MDAHILVLEGIRDRALDRAIENLDNFHKYDMYGFWERAKKDLRLAEKAEAQMVALIEERR